MGCSSNENTAPVVEELAFTLDEDESIDIELFATNEEGDELVFCLDVGAENGSLTIEDAVVTYQSGENYHGGDGFGFLVSDGLLSTASTVSLAISTMNDATIGTVIITGTAQVG